MLKKVNRVLHTEMKPTGQSISLLSTPIQPNFVQASILQQPPKAYFALDSECKLDYPVPQLYLNPVRFESLGLVHQPNPNISYQPKFLTSREISE